MNSPADDIAQYLVSQGVGALGGTADWAINVDYEPPSPDNVITIYNTGGPGADTDEQNIQYPTVQIRIRSKGNTAGWTKHEEIRDILAQGAQPKVMASSNVHVLEAPDLNSLGRDENKRFLRVADYRLMRSALSA